MREREREREREKDSDVKKFLAKSASFKSLRFAFPIESFMRKFSSPKTKLGSVFSNFIFQLLFAKFFAQTYFLFLTRMFDSHFFITSKVLIDRFDQILISTGFDFHPETLF